LWAKVKCRPDVKKIGEEQPCGMLWKKKEMDESTLWMKREIPYTSRVVGSKTTHAEYVK